MAKINSKNKGNRIELELAKKLTERFEQEFKRVPLSGAWGTSNRNSEIREDALEVLSGDIMCPKNFIFSVESKGRAEFNFWDMLSDTKNEIDKWIEQAENDAKIVGKYPLLYIKINNRKPFVLFPDNFPDAYAIQRNFLIYKRYVIMRFDYFLELMDDFFFDKDAGKILW